MAEEKRITSRQENISIRALYSLRDHYENYPPFQRDSIWTEPMKRHLIDSILRGFHIPAIIAYEGLREAAPEPTQCAFIVDGQQRLSAIFDFLDGEFPTANSNQRDEPRYAPIEPNRYFKDLSPRMKSIFLSYTLQFTIVDKPDDQLLGVMFRRLQNQVPLTQSEKLWSYGSETTRQAKKLIDHPFWRIIYQGNTARKQAFQAAMYFIFFELSNGFANVTTPRLKDLAAGQKDMLVTDSLIETIRGRLDAICHLFYGTTITAMTNVIPLYQAVLLLAEKGCDTTQCRQGCLTSWFAECYQQYTVGAENSRLNGFLTFSSQISKSSYQRSFWDAQLPIVLAKDGLTLLPPPDIQDVG